MTNITVCLNVVFFFKRDRQLHIPHYFHTQPNAVKFNELFGTEDIDILEQVAIFCKKVVCHFDRIRK